MNIITTMKIRQSTGKIQNPVKVGPQLGSISYSFLSALNEQPRVPNLDPVKAVHCRAASGSPLYIALDGAAPKKDTGRA
jgi:hypothetical protein